MILLLFYLVASSTIADAGNICSNGVAFFARPCEKWKGHECAEPTEIEDEKLTCEAGYSLAVKTSSGGFTGPSEISCNNKTHKWTETSGYEFTSQDIVQCIKVIETCKRVLECKDCAVKSDKIMNCQHGYRLFIYMTNSANQASDGVPLFCDFLTGFWSFKWARDRIWQIDGQHKPSHMGCLQNRHGTTPWTKQAEVSTAIPAATEDTETKQEETPRQPEKPTKKPRTKRPDSSGNAEKNKKEDEEGSNDLFIAIIVIVILVVLVVIGSFGGYFAVKKRDNKRAHKGKGKGKKKQKKHKKANTTEETTSAMSTTVNTTMTETIV